MNGLSKERKNALNDLLAEEQRIKGLVSELRLTLAEGNNLLQSASTLSEQLNLNFSYFHKRLILETINSSEP